MFTIVNSTRKQLKHQHIKDAQEFHVDDSSFKGEKNFVIDSLANFFLISNDFLKLQLTIICLTFGLSIFFSLLSFIFISYSFGLSLFIGSIAGIFYLRLLAKSVGNLGKTSSSVSKLQLLVPICLFIFASKNEFIEILPAIIGFFLYKPSIVFYFSRS